MCIIAILPTVRLLFTFIVTLSFLAGQACGNGVRTFQSPVVQDSGELMSRMVVRCDAEPEHIAGASADCGPGRCVESIKDEPDDASVSAARADVSCPPVPAEIAQTPARLIAVHVVSSDVPMPSRPVPDVRRE